jgi:hypothetical protein
VKKDAEFTPGPGNYFYQKPTGSESTKITISTKNKFKDWNWFK